MLIGLGASILPGLGSLPEGARVGTWVRALPLAAILGAMLVDAALLGYLLWLIRRRIVSFLRSEARLRKQLAEITLMGQPFIKDPDTKVSKLLADHGATVKRFVRFEVGEGIEKKADNFVAEVMAQVRGA